MESGKRAGVAERAERLEGEGDVGGLFVFTIKKFPERKNARAIGHLAEGFDRLRAHRGIPGFERTLQRREARLVTEATEHRCALRTKPVVDVVHEEKMRARFAERNFRLTPNNMRQVRVLTAATVLTNVNGLAPGFCVHFGNADFYFVPGVPLEMKRMW